MKNFKNEGQNKSLNEIIAWQNYGVAFLISAVLWLLLISLLLIVDHDLSNIGFFSYFYYFSRTKTLCQRNEKAVVFSLFMYIYTNMLPYVYAYIWRYIFAKVLFYYIYVVDDLTSIGIDERRLRSLLIVTLYIYI